VPDKFNITAADKQLVEATLKGDISSFGIIVERYWDMVIAFALSKINNATDAEDIAQESFLKAYSQLHRLRNPSCFLGWLCKIVDQQCVNHIRKNAHNKIASRRTTYDVDASVKVLVRNSNPGLTDEQACFVRQTVSRLPEKFRKVIIMRFMAGLSAVQIAKQLNKRPGTVRVWLHRAYQILRRDLIPILEEVE
jgi:RNA polymerase sigma-70 factor (ECF subfamily)